MNPPNQLTPTLAPTPRTDAARKRYEDSSGNPCNAFDYVEPEDMATLERELAETERLRFGADAERRQLRCDLFDAKAEASHYMAVAQKATDELIFFRADNLKAHQMTCSAALERDSLRAEVERLKEQLRIESAASAHALHWAEKAEAALAASRYETVQAAQEGLRECIRAEKAEAERDALAKDKERLDWLAVSDTWFDYPAIESFNPETFRDAIDAAMKGTP